MKTNSPIIEPILNVLGRRREGASCRTACSTKPEEGPEAVRRRRKETGGVSYVKEEAKWLQLAGCVAHDCMKEWPRSVGWSMGLVEEGEAKNPIELRCLDQSFRVSQKGKSTTREIAISG